MSSIQTTNVPAHIAARINARKGENKVSPILSAVVGSDYSYPKISIRAGRYRLVENGVETPVGITLDVVIVGANPRVSKVFYARPYDGNAEGIRPDCFSNDGIRPDPSVQNPVHSSCLDCPNNVLGSKITPSGAKSKLCGDQRHLAVVPAADPSKVYALSVPVAAMRNLREYFKELQNYGIAPEEVVTELGFDEQVSFPKITFSRKGYVPESALAKIDELVDSDEVKEAVRLIPPRNSPALAAPLAEETEQVEQPVSAPVATTSKATKKAPKQEPVIASSALESKLDAIFGDE